MTANHGKFGGSQLASRNSIPDLTESLVPLSIIIERVIASIFNHLSILAETLPSAQPNQRAINIVNFSISARKHVIKLLVLLRWARDPIAGSDKISIARSINEMLWRQNFIFQAAIQGLRDVGMSFSSARVPSADILTAVDVLQSGTYHGLPVGLRRAFKPDPPLPASAVISHLDQLNDVIRFRLRTKEIIPNSMKQIPHTIADGRVHFHVKNLFTCSVTLSGRSDDDIWFLLSVQFDIDSSDYTQSPKFALRDEILAIANDELASKPPKSSKLGDAPLVRLCNLLTNLSLNYKMEILHTQALKMTRKTWKNRIDMSFSKDRKNLSIGYWLRPRQQPRPGQSPPPHQKHESGRLNISIATVPYEKQNAVESILNRIEIKSKLKATALADDIIDQRLQVEWIRNDNTQVGYASLELNSDTLSIERVMLQALASHSVALLDRYKNALCTTSMWFNDDTVQLQIPEVLGLGVSPTLHVQVFETHKLILSISPTTGRLIVRDPNESGTSAPARIKTLLDRMNEAGGISDNTAVLVEIVNRLRQSIAIEDIEQKCSYLDLKGSRRLKFAKGELSKLKLQARFWMFVHLPTCSIDLIDSTESINSTSNTLFTMAIAIGEARVHVALLGMKEKDTELHVDYVGWLDTGKILGDEKRTDYLLLDTNHMRTLYAYSLARFNYVLLERQLKQFLVPYSAVASHKGSRLARLIPHMAVSTSSILKNHGSIAEILKPVTVFKVLDWWATPMTGCRIQATFKPKAPSEILQRMTRKNGGNTNYNNENNVIEITTTDAEQSMSQILGQLTTFVKVTMIAHNLSRSISPMKLLANDTESVKLGYLDSYTVVLRWNPFVKGLYADFGGESNPHTAVQEDLNRRLQEYMSDSSFFYRFSQLLLNTANLTNTTKSLTNATVEQKSCTYLRVKGAKEIVDILLVERRVVIVDGTRSLKNKIEPIIYSRLVHSEMTSLDSIKQELLDKYPQQTKIIDSGVVLNDINTAIKVLPLKRRSAWSPSFFVALRLLLVARFLGAMYSIVTDCDETYNYWEALHYLTHQKGFQTWEYSPEYSIRSWFYVLLNSPVAFFTSYFEWDKRIAFFGTRSYLALISSLIEASFYASVTKNLNPRVGRYVLLFLIGSAGMYISAIAFLPSSLTLYTTTLASNFALYPPTHTSNGQKRCLFATMSFAVGAIAGWPFSLALSVPFVLEQLLMYSGGAPVLKKRVQHLTKSAAISSLLFIPVVAIDTLFYGKLTAVSVNIIKYNVFSGNGPTLYGVEPAHFYILNLLLNFNLVFLLAVAALPLAVLFERRHLTYVAIRLAPFYGWFVLLSLQQHKEERFMFPSYTLLCFNAAVGLYYLRNLVTVAFTHVAKTLTKSSKVSISGNLVGRVTTCSLIAISLVVSVMRVLAMQQYYHAPIDILFELTEKELANRTGPPKGQHYTLCYGKDWYRFPSSYLVPQYVDVEFVESKFDGILPAHWPQEFRSSANLLNNIRRIPPNMNDQNKQERDRFVNVDSCDYLIDLVSSSTTFSLLEPNYAANDDWNVIASLPMLDPSLSHILTRTLYLPFKSWQQKNTFGELKLHRRNREIIQ
ncbi:hypothetical protein E3P86_01304 [Wallemia ichthyophaga]|uniref:Mediator of RNA polymerase II transcription subunit 14 n=1 Tax=Wallemia ichthyophaga TaxID=245174 RepID=A0A4T0JA09_WALIC|nr:hypothetical protein E3P86_01304 [Wallemia ichthyophaga]